MPFPPIDEAPRSMTRRNYLVELNRLRVKRYEPTRKALEDEDLRIAREQEESRKKMLDSWKSRTNYAVNTTRPLPGGGPRSAQMREAAALKNPNMIKIFKEEEAQIKAQRTKLVKAEMKQQIKEREDYLREFRKTENAYINSLIEAHKEQAKMLEEKDKEDARALREYMNRMRESNLKEMEQKRMKQKARDEFELSILRTIQENENKKAAEEENRAKNLKRLMQLENEENRLIFERKQKEDFARDQEELRTLLEHNAALAERERQEQIKKREQYKKEFEETVAKQKAIKELQNYDEPPELCRKRMQEVAESLAIIKREERRRLAERRQEYHDDLMRQIREKQEWRLEHIDGI